MGALISSPLHTVDMIPNAPIGASVAANACFLLLTWFDNDLVASAPTSAASGENAVNASAKICRRSSCPMNSAGGIANDVSSAKEEPGRKARDDSRHS